MDEWGSWHPVEKGKPTGGLYQQNTMRDACVATLTLDLFHNHADKLFMANIAQLINVLQALLLVEDDKCIKTPTYHVFNLYRPHKGGQAVRFVSAAETVSDGEASKDFCRTNYLDKQPFELRAVHGSASMKDNKLCVTVVNTHPSHPVELDLDIHQGRLSEIEFVSLYHEDIHAHNTFDKPDVVQLSSPKSLEAHGKELRVTLPAGSICRIMGKLT